MDKPPILIKKYPNRRLYNTATSSYIVLDDIIALVKDGTEFVVKDKKTGEVITRSILNQIIFEQETTGQNFHFPLDVQKSLIALYGENFDNLMPQYLSQSMKLFEQERNRMSKTVENTVSTSAKAMAEMSQKMATQNMEMFKRSWEMFGRFTGMEANLPETDASGEKHQDDRQDSDSELDDIQKKIDALQNRLKALK